EPWFEVPPPKWIRQHLSDLSGVFVIVDHGPVSRKLERQEAVFGANMAFRKSVANAFPLNVSLGRITGNLFGADDTELIRRVTDAGMFGAWVPDARVQHFNPAERLTKRYIMKWYRDAGRSLVRQGGISVGPAGT